MVRAVTSMVTPSSRLRSSSLGRQCPSFPALLTRQLSIFRTDACHGRSRELTIGSIEVCDLSGRRQTVTSTEQHTGRVLPPDVSAADFDAALAEFRRIVGDEWVADTPDAISPYEDAFPVT